MVRKFPRTAGRLLAVALLLAAGACDLSGTAPAGGGATPTPTGSPKPFFPALASIGGSTFAQVTGAPAGSICTVRAFLKPAGPEISGPGLKPRTVTNPANGASWDSNNGDQLFKPGTASGQKAYWQFACSNADYDPTVRTITRDFDTP